MLRGQKFLAVADGDSIQFRVRQTPAAKKLSEIDPARAFGFALGLIRRRPDGFPAPRQGCARGETLTRNVFQ